MTPEHVEHFRWRVLQDALAQATAAHWDRRAQTLKDAATARPSDRPDPDPTRAAKRRQRLTQQATACRNHARLLRETGLDAETRTHIDTAYANTIQEGA